MIEFIYFFIFACGAAVGSFLNVLLLRKNTGEPLAFGNSKCFSCGARLRARNLVPILSFVLQKGKCEYCGSKIFWQYPIVEMLVGVLAVVIYAKFSIFPDASFIIFNKEVGILIFYFFAFSSLFLVAAYDFRTKIIDSHFLYVFGVFAVLEFLLRGNFLYDAVSAFLIASFFYLMWLVSGGRWMGRGDADLAFFTSLFLGWPLNLAALFLSFWIGGLVGVALLLVGRGFNLHSEIPFGPFLVIGAFLAWHFSDVIVAFYGMIMQ